MRLRTFLFSFVLSMPFWWGVNSMAQELEGVLLWDRILPETPNILTADLLGAVRQKRDEKEKEMVRLASKELDIKAKSAISIEFRENGGKKIIFAKNPAEPLPIASLSKLMTALVVSDLQETYNHREKIGISGKAVAQEGNSRYRDLKEGEKISVENLLNIMLIESSNDAAFALADFIGEEGFVELMNIYAKTIGLSKTEFANPTGLESKDLGAPKNVSTAEEMAELSLHILKKYPAIFEMTTRDSFAVFEEDAGLLYFIPENTNLLLKEFPAIKGGKTGWEMGARGCLILVFDGKEPGSRIINVILGSEDRFGEMRRLVNWQRELFQDEI